MFRAETMRTSAAGVAAFLLLGFAACGGPSEKHCAAESEWSGTCVLKSVAKLREAEFPVPHVVLEVIYEPQQSPSSPNFTPPAIREEVKILASQELELRAHLERNAQVTCNMAAPAPGSCQPGPMAVSVPPFTPTGATAASEVHGCAQIESQATQDNLPALSQNTTPIPETFSFADSSSEVPPDGVQAASRVAARLRDNPAIECIAVVGQVSPGESPALAQERANRVRQLLVTGGIDAARITTVALTQQVYGAGTQAPPPDPSKRRAVLRVLLERR